MRSSDDARLRQQFHAESHERPFGILAAIMQPFCTLHRIAWSAPWAEQRR
ncbi:MULTISPECIES: hypothetical protein [Sphingobium]|nr:MULTISPECIES: hypothetical protein [Sphingobium]